MAEIYAAEFGRVARLAFSMWNRDPASPSYGSFDRQYWGWKYKDFSDATLQYAVLLAAEYAQRSGRVAELPSLLEAWVDFCASIQHRDGSFDQCYPVERTPGVIYDMLPALTYVLRSPHLRSATARAKLERMVGAAVRFALSTDEKHGEIANHLAEYAAELFDYAALAGDRAAETRAVGYLERMRRLFEREEGWFTEYRGPDAGYQTRCLRYVTRIAAHRGDEALWQDAERAAAFVGQMMMPDHSLHPMLGTRSTALLYPSGFERLAARSETMRGLAARVREAWRLSRVPLPSEIDFSNAIRLGHDALDAADGTVAIDAQDADQAVPRQSVQFPKAQITVHRSPARHTFVAWGMGGVVVSYSRSADGRWVLSGESSGYLLKSAGESPAWLTRMPGSGQLESGDESHCEVRAPFVRSLHDEMNPLRMILLRVLNLTVLRVQPLADLFRKLVVRKLMSSTDPISLWLVRRIEIGADSVTITDSVDGPALAQAKGAYRLFACRRMSAVHMASARYFQAAEMTSGDAWTEELHWDSMQHPRVTRFGSAT